MDKARLMEVLNDSTCLVVNSRTERKMPGIPVLLWGLLLHANDPAAANMKLIDCHFVNVAVNPVQAENHRSDFIRLLETFPNLQKLHEGPSYKHVASVVGDEITALRVFGLGQTLGLWSVLLPDQFGVDPELVDEAADLGMIMTTGYESQLFSQLQVAVG